jgi:hypothetical protein
VADEHNPTTQTTEDTVEAEEREARAAHRADRPPTSQEDESAPEATSPGTDEHFEDMAERGASEKGEGRLP